MSVQLRDPRATRPLRALFTPRKRRSTFLTATIDKTATSLTVASGAAVTSSPIYVGAEAITWTSVAGNTVSGLGRGAYGSTAQVHYGGASDGAGVFLTPPSWKGKKCWLRAVYVDDNGDEFTSNADEIGTIGNFVLSGAPQMTDTDVWTLRADDPIIRFAEAKAYTGQREVVPIPGFEDFHGSGGLTISGDDLFLFLVATNPIIRTPTKLLTTFRSSGARQMNKLESVGSTLVIAPQDHLIVPEAFTLTALEVGEGPAMAWSSTRHVAVVSGDPAWVFLTILLSRTGNATNHSLFDTMPGKIRAAFQGDEWFMGANLPIAQVAITEFLRHRGNSSLPLWVFLDRETSVMELAAAYTLATRTFLYVDDNFALSCGKLRDRVPPSTAAQNLVVSSSTVRASTVDQAEVDEDSVFHRGVVRANFDPLQNKYLAEFNIIDWEIQNRYPNSSGERVFESKYLNVDVASYGPDLASAQTVIKANPASPPAVEMMVHRLQQNNARPRLLVRVEVTWAAITLRTGQTVLATLSRVPDLQGSTLNASPCRIIGRRPNIRSQTVELLLEVLEDGYLVAPAHTVSAYVALQVTFRTDDVWSIAPTTPANNFAATWDVWCVDTSPATWVWEKIAVTSIVSPTVLTLASAPTFGLTAGDLIILAKKVGNTATNAAGYAPNDYLYQNNANATDELGAETDIRWS